jgi:uncharacterized membrane protein YbhN (UPF0104 family)
MRTGRWAPVLRATLSLAIAAVILYYLVRSLARGWREAGVYRWSVDWAWLALSLAVLAVYFFLAAWIWKRILRSMGEEIGTGQACHVWFLSQLGKYIPGKVWFALGRIYLARRVGVDAIPASVSTVLELLMVMLAAAAVFLASLPLWPSVAGKEILFAPAAIAVIVLLVHPAVFGALLRLATRVLRRDPVPYRFAWRDLALTAVAYALTWILYGAGLEILLRTVRLEGIAQEAGLSTAGRILFLSGAAGVAWTIGFLSFFTPSGLGVREATLGYMLAFHLPAPVPVLLALVARIWITVGEIGSAVVGWRLGGGNNET